MQILACPPTHRHRLRVRLASTKIHVGLLLACERHKHGSALTLAEDENDQYHEQDD